MNVLVNRGTREIQSAIATESPLPLAACNFVFDVQWLQRLILRQMILGNHRIYLLNALRGQRMRTEVSRQPIDCNPVSYTHLDVYKRQELL